jgi:hypothetical protein
LVVLVGAEEAAALRLMTGAEREAAEELLAQVGPSEAAEALEVLPWAVGEPAAQVEVVPHPVETTPSVVVAAAVVD